MVKPTYSFDALFQLSTPVGFYSTSDKLTVSKFVVTGGKGGVQRQVWWILPDEYCKPEPANPDAWGKKRFIRES